MSLSGKTNRKKFAHNLSFKVYAGRESEKSELIHRLEKEVMKRL